MQVLLCFMYSFFQSFEMLLSPGDNVIIAAPTYSGTLGIVSNILIHVKLMFTMYTQH